jgi:hypothetical protein
MRLFILCAVGVFIPWLAPCQQVPNLVVSGTVINSATGLPVPRALVMLRPGRHRLPENFNPDDADQDKLEKMTAPDPPQRAATDQEGKFSFSISNDTVSAQLEVKRAGFRSESHQDVAMLFLSPDRMANAVVKLAPLGVIQGRVLNEDGEPVPGATVETIPIYVYNGRRQLYEDAYKETDDLGEYRLWDLTPGLVYLKVTDRYGTATTPNNVQVAGSGQSFSPIYYPAAATQMEALPVRIHPGETIRADFVVEHHKAYQIRGVVGNAANIASYGKPWVRLLRGDDWLGARAFLDLATGAFLVSDVLPGSYTLQAFGNGSTPLVFGETAVTVEERDISGVVIPMTTGVDVHGKVEFPPRPKDPNPDPDPDADSDSENFASVQAQLNHPERLPPDVDVDTEAEVDEAGNFVLKNLLPGNYSIDVAGGSFVVSIQSGQTDVLSDGLTVGDTPPPELKIVLGAAGGSLECTVEGLEANSAAVVAAVRQHNSTNLIKIQATAAGNTVQFAPLAPGDYIIYAWPESRKVEYQSPAALAALSQYSVPIAIKEGSNAMVSVKLAPGEGQ